MQSRFIENLNALKNHNFLQFFGEVTSVGRNAIKTYIPNIKVGSVCEVHSLQKNKQIEIVSLDSEGHVGMPLDDLAGIRLGDKVNLVEEEASIGVGPELIGSVIDSTGVSYETGKPIATSLKYPLYGESLNPMDREIITTPLDLGVRAINACLTTGEGQRQGIFAGSGVGKSVLLGMMSRFTNADIVVIGLIGERGREVKEFIEKELGPEGRKKTIVVVETSDKSAVRRVRGAYAATAIAEYFKDRGNKVLLLMDSLTRFAMAQREIGIAAGEPPTTKGYTPSVFSSMSKILERAGHWGQKGSITGLYTILVEGDDLEDPVADNSRAILDGHIVLSRKLANKNQFPAIDILASVSRVMDQVTTREHFYNARKLKQTLSKFLENEDAIQYGMYLRGTDLSIDDSIEKYPRILEFLSQDRDEKSNIEDSVAKLSAFKD
jgi:flagellum-specific ATP synthase